MLQKEIQEIFMVRALLQKGIRAIVSKQTNIFSAAFFIIVTTILSQILGLLKYRLLISIFGASNDLGLYFAAFRVPDFLFQVLFGATLASCFIPIFSEYLARGKTKEALDFTSSLITIGLVFFSVISLLLIVFAYPISSLAAPGLSEKELVNLSNLTRIIQISELFFVLGTLATAILQSFQHFLVPGIASALYNLGIIVGVLVFAPFFGIYGAMIGVAVGSALFLVAQIPPLIMAGFRFRVSFNFRNEGLRRTFHLMPPRSLTILVSQIVVLASLYFSSFISLRSYSIFELAQTLVMAPVLLFGQSIAQASFPALSLKKDNHKEFLSIFMPSFNQILFLTLPISVLLIVLRIPIVRLVYGASRFDWQATVDTGRTLAFFSLSLTAQALLYLLSRAFYAHKDTKTPLFITIFSVVVFLFFSYLFILIGRQPIYYLAFSYSISSIISTVAMVFYVNRKVSLPKASLFLTISKISIASFVMGVALYVPIKLLDQLVFDTTYTINLIILTGIASFFGIVAYLFFTWLLDIQEVYYVFAVFQRFGTWRKILKQMGELIDSSKTAS